MKIKSQVEDNTQPTLRRTAIKSKSLLRQAEIKIKSLSGVTLLICQGNLTCVHTLFNIFSHRNFWGGRDVGAKQIHAFRPIQSILKELPSVSSMGGSNRFCTVDGAIATSNEWLGGVVMGMDWFEDQR